MVIKSEMCSSLNDKAHEDRTSKCAVMASDSERLLNSLENCHPRESIVILCSWSELLVREDVLRPYERRLYVFRTK